MKSCIGLLVLLLAAPLTQAQVPAVAPREAESIILVFMRGLELVEASRVIGVDERAGRLKVSGTDVQATLNALNALKKSLNLARQDSELQKEAARIIGNAAYDAQKLIVNQLSAEAKLAAKGAVSNCHPVNSYDIWSCSPKTGKWPLYSEPKVVAYRVDVPVVLGYSKVKVDSLIIYGSPALVDYLFASRFIDCGPHLPSTPSCKFTSLKNPRIASDARQDGGVKLLLNNPEDFVEMYKALPQSQFRLLQSIQQEGKPRDGTQIRSTEKSEAAEGKEPDCEAEAKVCLSVNSASMVLGCEGKGEVEIDTNGQISFSMSVGAIATNEHDRN